MDINAQLRNTVEDRDQYILEQESIIRSLEQQVERLSMADVADPKDVQRLQEELRSFLLKNEAEKEEFMAFKLESVKASTQKDSLIKELQRKLRDLETLRVQAESYEELLQQQDDLRARFSGIQADLDKEMTEKRQAMSELEGLASSKSRQEEDLHLRSQQLMDMQTQHQTLQ